MTKPYIEKLGKRGNITIWRVDGDWIRTHKDEEFTNFGQHYHFSFIPKDEFWIDQGAGTNERRYFIDHLLVEYRLMQAGMSYNEALDRADAVEEKRRNRDKTKKSKHDPDSVHVRPLKHLSSGMTIWLVNEEKVQDYFYDDWVEGGNSEVDKFIPGDEIWIGDQVIPKERIFIAIHELNEQNIMKTQGLDYDKAHEKSSELEWECRHDKELLKETADKFGLSNWVT